MGSTKEIQENIAFFNNDDVVSYSISEKIIVIHNNNEFEVKVSIPDGKWNVVVNEDKAGVDIIETINASYICVKPVSYMVLIKG